MQVILNEAGWEIWVDFLMNILGELLISIKIFNYKPDLKETFSKLNLFSFFPFKREETEQKVSVIKNSAQKPVFPFFPCKLFCEPEV